MKKIFLCLACFSIVFLLSGCTMDNTPTKKVENFLDNYTNEDDTVLNQLKEMVDSDGLMDENQKNAYSDIMKRQYKDMTYEIKDEKIDGDNATVTAEIEVYDYYKANKESEDYYNNNPDEFKDDTETDNDNGVAGKTIEKAKDVAEDAVDAAKDAVEGAKDAVTGKSSESKYIEYRLGRLKEANDRVKYTIDFTLTKVDGVWTLNDIDDQTRQKIHGLYEH